MRTEAFAASAPFERRALASPGWLIPALLFSLVFIMAARTPIDSDLWWHLRAGEETLRSGQPLLVDTFSHTRAGATWINHSWLGQVAYYLIFLYGHYLGLGIVVALMATASLAFIYYQMEGPSLLRAFVIVLAAAVAAPVWSPRPQLISFLLFAGLSYLLYVYKWRGKDRLWLGIPLFILWSNLHAGYILGLLLIGCMLLGEVANRLLGLDGAQVLSWQRIRCLAIWGLLCGLVVAINPNGPATWLIPFRTVGMQVLQSSISEWASPDFHALPQQPLIWMLLLTLASVGLSRRRLDASDFVALAVFAYLALLARRNFAPLALVAAPLLSRHLSAAWLAQRRRWLSFRQKRGAGPRVASQNRNWINLPLVALLVFVGFSKAYLVSQPQLVDAYNQGAFPVKAAQWIDQNLPPGNLFNEYNWGGYLAWRLRAFPVFVDGRTDLYDDDLLEEYLHTISGEDGWETVLQRHGADLALLSIKSRLAREMRRSQAWQEVYRDEVAVVFLRDINTSGFSSARSDPDMDFQK